MTQAETGSEAGRRLLERAKELDALLFGEFTLTAGGTSSYYFDGRLLTLDPEGGNLVASVLLPAVRESGAEAVGGPAVGAVSMVTGLALLSGRDGGRPVPGFFVRAEQKGHGMGKLIEGPLGPPGSPVAVVDDACSTAGSLYLAIRAAEDAGHPVALVACILDRTAGGGDRLRADGYSFLAILEADALGNIRAVL